MQIRPMSLCLSLFLFTGLAAAQNWPTRPITINTTPPGASADMLSRELASQIAATTGQPVVVNNLPAGPRLATSTSRAAPDGYTTMVWAGGVWLGPVLAPQPYALSEFAPISLLTRSPLVLVVANDVPAKNVPEFIALAKAQPGKLNYTAGSAGSSSHIAGELFKNLTGSDIVAIFYKGSVDRFADLATGRVHLGFGNMTAFVPFIKSGKVRALAMTGPDRSSLFPGMAAVSETLPGFVTEQYFAFWAPAKTPAAIVKTLNAEAHKVLAKPDVRKRLINTELEPAPGTPEQLLEVANSEVARVTKLVKEAGLKGGD